MTVSFSLQVELTGSSVFDYVHPGDHVEMAEQLGMKLPPGRGISLSQGAVNEDGASSASSSSHSETPEPGEKRGRRAAECFSLQGKRRREEEIQDEYGAVLHCGCLCFCSSLSTVFPECYAKLQLTGVCI